MNDKIDVLDRDARTLYDLACIRAEREDATREDVEAQAIALRLWTNLAAIAELIEAADDFMSGGDEFGEVWRAERLRASLARVGGGK